MRTSFAGKSKGNLGEGQLCWCAKRQMSVSQDFRVYHNKPHLVAIDKQTCLFAGAAIGDGAFIDALKIAKEGAHIGRKTDGKGIALLIAPG